MSERVVIGAEAPASAAADSQDPCEMATLEEQALQWVPCADCLETGVGEGDVCEECGGWAMVPATHEADTPVEPGGPEVKQ